MSKKKRSAGSQNGSGDYTVGFGRPPKLHQFQKGQSGNPQGRPKRPRTLRSALRKVLARPVKVAIGGETKTVTTVEVLAMRMVKEAGDGKVAMLRLLTDLLPELFECASEDDFTAEEIERQIATRKVFDALAGFAEFKRRGGTVPSEPPLRPEEDK